MIRFLLIFSPLIALAAWFLSSAQAASTAEWNPLFDGKTLNGWVQRGGKAKFSVAHGEIVGSSVPGTGNSFLCTTRDYTNFVLELDFKTVSGLNSGVQIRSHAFDVPTEFDHNGKVIRIPAGRVHGYQIEIDPSERAWSGGVFEEGRRGWLGNLKTNEAARATYRSNDWNQFRIEATAGMIKTSINGVPAVGLKDAVTRSGFVGLQVHGVGNRTNVMEVRFRNIRIQELP